MQTLMTEFMDKVMENKIIKNISSIGRSNCIKGTLKKSKTY
jgi:hypothetical protein